jgi:hypothetical protein
LEAVSPVSTVSSARSGSAPFDCADALPLSFVVLLPFELPTAWAIVAPPRANAASAATPAMTLVILLFMGSLSVG